MLLHTNLSKLTIRGCFPSFSRHGYFSKTVNLETRSLFAQSRVLGSSPMSENVGMNNGGNPQAGKVLPWIDDNDKKEKQASEVKGKNRNSTWDLSAEKFFGKNGKYPTKRSASGSSEDQGVVSRGRFKRQEREHSEEEREEEYLDERIDNPKWYKIRDKYRPFDRKESPDSKFERIEVKKWRREENWGKKTLKEATESTVPKMVGQGVYGVAPVLAALTASRREFYALYVQENMDLGTNNKKKKDKKSVEKILQTAERIGLKVVETSKHNLNMVVDNRPHQGLVLDASPLEMVSIRELEPVSLKQLKVPVWVALDEVTDPQNLGAIIRSAYFFGVTGLVLCAKNSAPLTGVVSKASAGALEFIELRSCKNMMQFLASSVNNGWRVLGGSVSDKAVPITEIEGNEPTVLVLGSEGTGLRPLVERACTGLVRIPGSIDNGSGLVSGEESEIHTDSFIAVESLNVSVAAGVLLYHLIHNKV